jgi:large subunit ribosomal protein L11
MAKKIKSVLKLNLRGGSANPAPPVGPILGQAGINIMEFCSQYNEKTKDRRGEVIPALVTVFEDRTFKIELKLAPVSAMIMKELNLKAGTKTAGKEVVGTLTAAQVEEIAKTKITDTNTQNIESMKKMVIGTARSMGVQVTA